jgi:hypothetical protein
VPQSGTAGLERVTDGESRTGAGGVDDAMLAIRGSWFFFFWVACIRFGEAFFFLLFLAVFRKNEDFF